MAPRTTLHDLNRKARIRERELARTHHQMYLLERINDEQKARLKKLVAAGAKGQPVKASPESDWRDLRDMGVIRVEDGAVILTTLGREVAADETK